MTTADTTSRVKTPQADNSFRLPDPPEREPEDMTSAKHLAETGNMHHLKLHLGNPETTIVKSELYLALGRRGSGAEFRVPDLLIAFEANPELYERNNGYVVSEQGKPPEFVLEIASPSTRAEDNAGKRVAATMPERPSGKAPTHGCRADRRGQIGLRDEDGEPARRRDRER